MDSRRTECYIFEQPNEKTKAQIGRKNSMDNVRVKDGKIFKMQKKTWAFLVCALFLVIVCAAAIGLYLYLSNEETCSTQLCKDSAKNLRLSMNLSVKPCDDFYEFACGNWPNNHPIPEYQLSSDWFDAQQDILLKNISEFLQQKDSSNDPTPVVQARIFYKSCMKQSESEGNNFTAIADILKAVDLPITPFGESPSGNFSWVKTAVLSKGVTDQDFFISFSISSDPKNRTINRLHLTKPNGLSPLPTHRNKERILKRKMKELLKENVADESTDPEEASNDTEINPEYARTFIQYVRNMSQYVVQLNGEAWNETEFNKTIQEVLEFHTRVDKAIEEFHENDTLIPSYVSITQLQNMTDGIMSTSKIDWKNYFKWMFESTDVTLDLEGNDSLILMSDEGYFRQIFHLVESTPSDVIKFYMWMTVVATVAPYSNKPLQGFKEAFVFTLTGSVKRPRDVYCADVVNQMLGMATAYAVVNDDFLKQKIDKIQIMVDDILEAFADNTKRLPWMDENTKNATVRKIQAMKKLIGIPTWLNDTGSLNEYYENITVNENDFLGNILGKIQKDHKDMLLLYREVNDFDQETWISNPMDVNAYNYVEGNTITIPAGILQFPFYGQGLEVLNYGAIGSVIGHEITHSFDNTGKEFDDLGNVNPWWSNKTTNEFENRTHCFIDFYGSFDVPGLEDIKVNGQKTLDENIADNGGLRSAFIAYKKYVKTNGKEKKLVDFENYTSEQLYFLGFANTWCEHSSPNSLPQAASDNHSPNKVRVIATLSNSEEFAEAWSCGTETAMNRKRDKCRMW